MALEEKLAAANQENVRRAKRLVVLACLAGLGIVLFALSSSWDPAQLGENIIPPDKIGPAPGRITAPSKAKTTVDQAVVISNLPVNPDKAVPSSREPDCTTSDQSDELCQKTRTLFKEDLKAFKTNLEPPLKVGSVHQWAPDVHAKIFENKRVALKAFSDGDYSSALAQIRAAAAESSRILKVREANFDTHLKAAVSGFESNQYEPARAEIDNALLLYPNDQIAQEYRVRIELMPKVLGYLEESYKAWAENDFRSELSYLEKIIQLDPARKKEKSRLDLLSKKIAEEDFAILLSKGLQAIEHRDLGAAQINLEKARRIFSNRAELSFLKENIERLDRELSIANALRDANQAVSHDDWDRAYQAFSKAKSIDPTNSAATEGERIATELLAGRQGLDSFLKQPARLSSKTVATAAQWLLENVRHLTRLSPTLKVRSERLSKLISQANTPVEVVVKSDGKTEITVRRVGIVGKTLEKVINLRPGDYTFEGKRAGYKSKLVKLTVPFNGTGIEIRIICDEQI